MAEMTTLVTAVYKRYTTTIAPGFEDTSPAITSRFELFFDETKPHISVSRFAGLTRRLVADINIGTYVPARFRKGYMSVA